MRPDFRWFLAPAQRTALMFTFPLVFEAWKAKDIEALR
jgi:hypothetical protein